MITPDSETWLTVASQVIVVLSEQRERLTGCCAVHRAHACCSETWVRSRGGAACGGGASPKMDMRPKAKRFDSVRCMLEAGRALESHSCGTAKRGRARTW